MIKTDFVPNNVQFQIIASNAWTDFYKVREFLLNQLIISESRFSVSCKETFLYTLHQLRFWLIELEEHIKMSKNQNLSKEELRDIVSEEIDELSQYMENIIITMTKNEDQFDRGFTEVFIRLFKVYKPIVLTKYKRLLRKDLTNCFADVVKFTAQFSSHMLHVLYEMDYLYSNQADKDSETFYPFISLDFVDVNLYRDNTKVVLVNERIQVYKEFGLINRKSYWTVKSYWNRTHLDNDFGTFQMFNKLMSEIELHGIRIACVM
jgi:hypothetical protein